MGVIAAPSRATGAAKAATPPGAWHSFVALVRRGLRDGRRTPLTWGGPLGAMGVLYSALYPSIENQLTDMISNYPSSLKEAWASALLAGADPTLPGLVRGMANVWPLAVAFAGLATLVAGITRGGARVTAIAVSVLGLMYVVDLAGKLADLGWLRLPSFFRYYGSAVQDGIDPVHFAGLLVAGVLLAAAGALLFERRDLAA